ncbi:MAG: septum formation initiator family protein [Chitinispirillaceae bacterium]|nr:septum formation initiator family protein [Chitinispirillaceae bacterium]
MKRQRLFVVFLLGALFLGVTIAVVSGDQGLMTFYRTWRRMQRLRIELADSLRTVDSLSVEAGRLNDDTAYIERIAREKFGMARKNETIYKFVEEK